MSTLSAGEAQQESMAQGQSPTLPGTTSTAQWKPATRIIFRFGFAYLALYSLSGQIFRSLIYSFGVSFSNIGKRLWPMPQITHWTAAHLFHMAAPLHGTGSGDTAFDWVETFCILIIALIATAVWSLLDRRRVNYVTFHKWFRVFLRFALASQMFVYGFSKVLLLQMALPFAKLVEPYGNFSPMAASSCPGFNKSVPWIDPCAEFASIPNARPGIVA